MSDVVEDLRDIEEDWEELRLLHAKEECDSDCPYCDPDFEPFWNFQ